jgi:hypothetical protein
MYAFGPGSVILKPPSTATDLTIRRVMDVTEVNIDISQEKKELYGTDKDPLIVALTKRKVTLKLKQARVQAAALASILGGTVATGGKVFIVDESTGVISGATYTADNTTGFEDWGVKDETGKDLTVVTTVTAAGQYSVTSGGVYTFHSSATGKIFSVTYGYTVTTGETLTVATSAMGIASQFALVGTGKTVDGYDFNYDFPAVTFDTAGLPFKNEDFTMPELAATAFKPSGSTTVARIFFGQAL